MILDLIFGIVLGLLTGVLSLIPAFAGGAVASAGDVSDFGAALGGYLGWVNGYFPVSMLGTCLALGIAVKVFLSGWDVIVWVYDKLPLKFT